MRVIGTLALLGVAAFALGAGAGLLWQEPRLVVADLLGDTQEVPWAQPQDPRAWPEGENDAGDETAGADAPQPVAAAHPAAAAEPEVELPAVSASDVAPAKAAPAPAAQLAAAKPAAAKATPAVSAPPPRTGVAIQVGAFAERSAADALVKRLKGSGYAAYVVPGSAAPFRVRVGPYGDRAKADAAATKLAKLSLPTWVLEEPGGR